MCFLCNFLRRVLPVAAYIGMDTESSLYPTLVKVELPVYFLLLLPAPETHGHRLLHKHLSQQADVLDTYFFSQRNSAKNVEG